MSFLISDNNFTRDSYGLRATRLSFLSNSISNYAVELSVSGEILSWAVNAYENFSSALSASNVTWGSKISSYSTFQNAFEMMSERYQMLKNILISRYEEDSSKFNIYGINKQTPWSNGGIIQACEVLTEAHAKLKESGDTNVLPDNMIDDFQLLIDDAREKHLAAGMMRDEALKLSKELQNLYNSDSKKLKAIYSWVVSFWGKDNPKLIALGFVESKINKGGRVPDAPVNLLFNPDTNKISWDAVDDITSYQMAFAEAGKKKTLWQTDYSGIENEALIDTESKNLKIKVRARNTNGFGKWSEEISVNKN